MTKSTHAVNGSKYASIVSPDEFVKHQYDYLICGGGTAGLCVAARLSEDSDVTVGVIEAGENRLDDPNIDVPALVLSLPGNTEYDYKFMTTPQSGGRKHHMVRGKLLGGSSGLNWMLYTRGSLSDFDDWAELTGDDGWSAKNMKQYMQKHEKLEPFPDNVGIVESNHGYHGPIHTSFNDETLPIEEAVLLAADHALGFTKKPSDAWSGDHIGFYKTLHTITTTGPNKGKRSYAAREYFQPNANRSNLKVVVESTIARVVLQGNKATGVEFIHEGCRHHVSAAREIIVCGGVVNSPQILELSGIGDPEILKAAGVECKINLPSVGDDLQDHLSGAAIWELAPGVHSADAISKDPKLGEAAQKTYDETQSGPLSRAGSAMGFYPISHFLTQQELDEIVNSIRKMPHRSEFHKRQRELIIKQLLDPHSGNSQLVPCPLTFNSEGIESDQSNLIASKDKNSPDGFTFAFNLSYPVARGRVHIKSSDPYDHPEIDPQYLSNEADHLVLAAQWKFIEALTNAPVMKDKLGKRLFPSADKDMSTLEARRQFISDFHISTYHVCGSCAMGSSLDSRLRVRGVQNLRVADASSFPNHTSGNIMSAVYALAERAADIIKEDWKSKRR